MRLDYGTSGERHTYLASGHAIVLMEALPKVNVAEYHYTGINHTVAR